MAATSRAGSTESLPRFVTSDVATPALAIVTLPGVSSSSEEESSKRLMIAAMLSPGLVTRVKGPRNASSSPHASPKVHCTYTTLIVHWTVPILKRWHSSLSSGVSRKAAFQRRRTPCGLYAFPLTASCSLHRSGHSKTRSYVLDALLDSIASIRASYSHHPGKKRR